jgi:hypothetical protein
MEYWYAMNRAIYFSAKTEQDWKMIIDELKANPILENALHGADECTRCGLRFDADKNSKFPLCQECSDV